MKMAAGSGQIPEASGQPLSSRWDGKGRTGHQGGLSPLCLLGWEGTVENWNRPAMKRRRCVWCVVAVEAGHPMQPKEVLRRGSVGSAVIFVFLGHGVTEGERIRAISLCFVLCHKKKRKRSKKRGGGAGRETEEERKKKKKAE